LKLLYAGPGGKTEVTTGEYIADGMKADGEIIEVQTGSFAPLKAKMKELAAAGKARIIYPVAVIKKIEVYEPASGRVGRKKKLSLLYRRKSPIKGSFWNLFDALIYAPELPLVGGLSIEVALVETIEKRVKDGKGSWRRKGMSVIDRELIALRESILFKKPADYLRFIPFKKKEEFTSALLAQRAEIGSGTAVKALYVLNKIGVVKRIGKHGNSWLYKKC
jgi:hypothetical protein